MIQFKILLIEQEIINNTTDNLGLLEAVNSIKNLLKQIDFKAEVVPLENLKRVCNLFESLKNQPLTNSEKILIKRLVKFN